MNTYNNIFLKLLISTPIILLFLYYIPIIGICLTFIKINILTHKSKIIFSSFLIMVGILILIPKWLSLIIINNKIKELISLSAYINLIKFSKLLITMGILSLLLSFAINNIFSKLLNFIKSYLIHQEKLETEIMRKNDMIMKEKREKAQNTHLVYCPYCGADNLLTSKIGKCKYCRKQIEVKNEK